MLPPILLTRTSCCFKLLTRLFPFPLRCYAFQPLFNSTFPLLYKCLQRCVSSHLVHMEQIIGANEAESHTLPTTCVLYAEF